MTGATTGYRNECEERPIPDEQTHRPGELSPPAREAVDRPGAKRGDGDALQDAKQANLFQPPGNSAIKQDAEAKQNQAARRELAQCGRSTLFDKRTPQRQRNRDAGDKDKQRKDQIEKMEAFPLHVLELCCEKRREPTVVRLAEI